MNNITLDVLLSKVRTYNRDVKLIEKAYNLAAMLHDGQFRQSGEPYIIHPLNVAYILAEMKLDQDTICAGLLHDVVEDTSYTIKDIKDEFNKNVATLVDGVTKISNLDYLSHSEKESANTRKIIVGARKDIRIILIKLADRLHNMRTLQYKSEYKQKENAAETMDIFAPLAYILGAYHIKNELEDLSFKYLMRDQYEKYKDIHDSIMEESKPYILEMLYKINKILDDEKINHQLKIRIKHTYGIYKAILQGMELRDIHDLRNLKIILPNEDDCYLTLGKVHKEYHPLNNKFKDYICNPKTNLYQSLHTTVFAPNDILVQVQIKTFDMEQIASYGLAGYFYINNETGRKKIQKTVRNRFQFYDSLKEIDRAFSDNNEFVNYAKSEILGDKVYLYTPEGDVIELPLGANAIDLAYRIDDELGNKIDKVLVNDEEYPIDKALKTGDIVKIITNDNVEPSRKLEKLAATTSTKIKIRKYLNNKA